MKLFLIALIVAGSVFAQMPAIGGAGGAGTISGTGCIPAAGPGKILVAGAMTGTCDPATPTISGSTITASLTGAASLNLLTSNNLSDVVAATARTNLGLTVLATTTPGTGVATFLATPSSANLGAALTDESGTGVVCFTISCAMTTPSLGTPSAATLTNATGLPISTGVSGLGTGVATALGTAVSGSGAICLATGSACSGGGGASAFYQLTDFSAVKTSGTVLTIGTGCAASTPCQLRQGSVVYTLASAPTVTISGTSGSETVYVYLSSSLVLTVGHNAVTNPTLTCSAGCTVATGVTGFPADSIPLWAVTFASNVWDTIAESMDKRSLMSRSTIAPGDGISSSSDPTSGIQTLTTDSTVVPRYFVASGAPMGSCTSGRDFYTRSDSPYAQYGCQNSAWASLGGGGGTVTEVHSFPACITYAAGASASPLWETISGVTASALGGSVPNPCGLIFDTSGTAEARIHYWLNPNWSGTIKITFATESLAGSGVTNTLSVKTACVATGGVWLGPTYNTPQTVNFASDASANNAVFGSINSLTTTGCSAGNVLLINVIKSDTNAAMSVLSAAVEDSHN